MKLLFDQNLSRHLVGELAPWFPDSGHVAPLGIETATDRELWAYAGENGYLIVSKDSDLRQLAFLLGPPPKAVWLRVGQLLHLGHRRALAYQRRRHHPLRDLEGRSTPGACPTSRAEVSQSARVVLTMRAVVEGGGPSGPGEDLFYAAEGVEHVFPQYRH